MKTVSLILLFFTTLSHAANVIFVHPDGAGISQWQAARMFWKGPDSELWWDRLPHIGIYRGHMSDSLSATSNGGATAHAYGVKVSRSGFGADKDSATPPTAASGKPESLMQEARRRSFRTGLINSGSIIEPGTAAWVASVAKRSESEEITRQVVESGIDIILCGGEEWLLPEGEPGEHGGKGKRSDGRNLINEAKEKGYTVVLSKEDLAAVPPETKKLLGIFANGNTYNAGTEAELQAKKLPYYNPDAPTVAEMTTKALELFGSDKFFLVVEEEGSDDFGNNRNAHGVFEALKRADDTYGVILKYQETHPDTLLLTTADSSSGGMDIIGLQQKNPMHAAFGAVGRDFSGSTYETDDKKPFIAAPDKSGQRLPFIVVWGTSRDVAGGIAARAAGAGAEAVRGSIDNTQIYTIMRNALFESDPDQH